MNEFARTWMSDRFAPAQWPAATALGLALVAASTGGCISRGNVEALEAQLRQTQDHLRRSEKQLARANTDLDLARKESDLLQKQFAQAEQMKGSLLPEQTQSLARIAGLSINKLMSGGKDQDGDRQDEAMQVIVSPLDGDGDLVKIAGQMEIEAFDLSRAGDDKRIGHWVFDSTEARKHWHSGFLSSGFQFHLPWQQAPSGKNVLVHARLTTSDGRQFDTDQTLVVNVDSSGMPAGRSNLQLGAPSEPARLAPPPQMQQVVEQTSAEEARPLLSTSRPLRRTAEVTPIAASMEDTTIEVGKAALDAETGAEPDVPEVKRWPIQKSAELVVEKTASPSPKPTGSPIAKWAAERETKPEAQPVPPTVSASSEQAPWRKPPTTPSQPETKSDEARPAVVPPPRDPEGPAALPPKRTGTKPAAAVGPGAGSDADSRPFPRGLTTTSDAWTDETIPRLR